MSAAWLCCSCGATKWAAEFHAAGCRLVAAARRDGRYTGPGGFGAPDLYGNPGCPECGSSHCRGDCYSMDVGEPPP